MTITVERNAHGYRALAHRGGLFIAAAYGLTPELALECLKSIF